VLQTFGDAYAEAGRLGHQWVGPNHLLLALLRDDRPSTAQTVLHELGLAHGDAERRFVASLVDGEPPVRSTIAKGRYVTASPAFAELRGWVGGYAAAAGCEPGPEIVLIGLCWRFEERLDGVSRHAVLAALAERGVPVPTVAPPIEHVEAGERVDVPLARLEAVYRTLLAADRLVGFNSDADNDAAWVVIRPGDHEARALIAATVEPAGRQPGRPSTPGPARAAGPDR
jgi:hypothetical protein